MMTRQPKPATPAQAAQEAAILHAFRQRDYHALATSYGAATNAGMFGGHSALITRAIVQDIGEHTPGLLLALDGSVLAVIREAAVLCYLLGKATPLRRWFPRDVVTGLHLNGDRCVGTLIGAAYHRRRCDPRQFRFQDLNRTDFVISALDAASCEICRTLDGQRFTLDTLPELPHHACRRSDGCRLSFRSALRSG